jgi:dienelactone hydrolase
MKRVLVLGSLLVISLVLPGAARAQEHYWYGRLVTADRAWTVGIDIDESGAAPDVRLDLPSRWRLDVPADDVEFAGDSLLLSHPFLGLARLRCFDDSIVGDVMIDDGAVGHLHLESAGRPAVRERDIVLESLADGTKIGATIMLPPGDGPFPAAVVLHGGGDSSREEQPGYRFWGTWLARHGIVGLVYDKRGNGESGGSWKTVGFEHRAGDVAAAVRKLREFPAVDTGRVGLVGVSQGSWVADIVAAADARLGFVVHVSGPVVTVSEADGYAMRRSLLKRDAPAAATERLSAFWRMEVDAILHPGADRVQHLEQLVAAAMDEPWFERFPYRVGPVDGWWWAWYGHVADFDPVPELRASTAPMLWIYGDADTESDVSRNLQILQRLRDDGKPFEIAVFPRSGHGLMAPADALGRSLGTLTVAPGFFDTVFEFIHRTSYQAGPASG